MNVKFFYPNGIAENGKDSKPIEFISISGGMLGKDEVVREATDEDRRRYHQAYSEFKDPPVAPEVVAPPPAQLTPATPPIDPAGKVT